MNPLVTIFVIMLLTVVYNESQFVADYQDDYQKVSTKKPMPFALCDVASKRKVCKSSNLLRQFLKKADYLRDDAEYYSHEYAHDYSEDEDMKSLSRKTGQKRNNIIFRESKCATWKDVITLGEGFIPSEVTSITCDNAVNQPRKICSEHGSCQPIKHFTTVAFRHITSSGLNTSDCSILDIPIHIGCSCQVERLKKNYEK